MAIRDVGNAVSSPSNRLVGLVVKASASRVEDQEFQSRLRRDFSGSSGYPARRWRYRVSAGTCQYTVAG